ncbi:MAG: hypothetical protein DI605_10600 [Sphingomonas sp.]|nr:MAG: hypothetical protein DI605_10600 [Sphingomonas sp.]
MMRLARLSFGLALCAFSAAVAQSPSPDRLEVAGLKLGMTEADVTRTIRAFDGKAQLVSRKIATYPYSDGVKGFETPSFLSELEFRTTDSRFRIWFASPPAQPRAFAIHRYLQGMKNPPARGQFVAALDTKYGPAKYYYDPSRGANIAQWSQPGKAECAVSTNGSGRIPVDGGNETLMPPRAVDVLEGMASKNNPNLRRTMGTTMDAARCGVVLRYLWGGPANDAASPISEFYVWLVDQGGMVANSRQSTQWVKQLEAQAVRARQGQGVTPKL